MSPHGDIAGVVLMEEFSEENGARQPLKSIRIEGPADLGPNGREGQSGGKVGFLFKVALVLACLFSCAGIFLWVWLLTGHS